MPRAHNPPSWHHDPRACPMTHQLDPFTVSKQGFIIELFSLLQFFSLGLIEFSASCNIPPPPLRRKHCACVPVPCEVKSLVLALSLGSQIFLAKVQSKLRQPDSFVSTLNIEVSSPVGQYQIDMNSVWTYFDIVNKYCVLWTLTLIMFLETNEVWILFFDLRKLDLAII